ncbi:MAG: hemolysin III family protein [Deltaproteobacteria bacterium]|nr:hemolysin III family protein [Deltaproteobacteria bacterium]
MHLETQRFTLGRMQNPVRGFLHGTAALLSVAGAIALWIRCAGGLSQRLALLTFGLSLVALYTVSSLYHSVPWSQRWKERMQRLDHSMIYVLVAGTYTPIAYIVLEGWLRWAALAGAWGITAAGIAQKAFLPRLRPWFSVTLQTTQGWLALPLFLPLAQRLPFEAVALAGLGGIFYTAGMVFYATQRPRLWPQVFSHHELFHVCVIAGSAAHYAMTFAYVARFAGG